MRRRMGRLCMVGGRWEAPEGLPIQLDDISTVKAGFDAIKKPRGKSWWPDSGPVAFTSGVNGDQMTGEGSSRSTTEPRAASAPSRSETFITIRLVSAAGPAVR